MTFKTMLAGKADPAKLKLPALASPKLDGVRAHIIDGVVVSRNLLPFKNPDIQKIFGQDKFNGLDGEFMVGDPTDPAAFRQTGVLNSHSGDCSSVKLHVFDDFTHPHMEFQNRFARVQDRIWDNPQFQIVNHLSVGDLAGLDAMEAMFLEMGYEGLMLRDPTGPYKHGRSTTNEGYLLKLKRFEDGEAEIIGYEERMHNANEKTLIKNGKAARSSHKAGKVATDTLGALIVFDLVTQVEFNIGSGFSDAERAAIWADRDNLNHKIVKYQYFPTGSKDKPRFPTFRGFRDPIDL